MNGSRYEEKGALEIGWDVCDRAPLLQANSRRHAAIANSCDRRSASVPHAGHGGGASPKCAKTILQAGHRQNVGSSSASRSSSTPAVSVSVLSVFTLSSVISAWVAVCDLHHVRM
jgi:hypothetical protein